MPPGAFPTRATLQPLDERELQPERMVTRSPQFADGGYDFNLDADTPIRRWEILYDGHTEAEIEVLDDHASNAKYSDEAGSAYGFDYTTRSGELLSDVRFAPGGYERFQSKTYSQGRRVKLVKYP